MNLRPIVRTSVGVATAASLAVLLAACGSSNGGSKAASTPSPSSSPTAATTVSPATCDKFVSGDASKAVTVTGAYNGTPSIKIAGTPTVKGIERTVVTTGKGAMPTRSDTANVHLTLFNAKGTKIGVQNSQANLGNATSNFLTASLMCAPYGSRIVVVASAADVYGNNLPSILKATDTLYLVSDVVSKYGPTPWTSQSPQVSFDSNGKPKVTLVGSPLKTWSIKILREGTGPVVQSDANVTLNYQGTSWNTHKIFDQSYGRGPATFNVAGVVPGFGYAIVGQKVGTRFIVTMPPALGYGTNPKDPNARGLGGQTLVFVIEILSTSK